MIRFDERLDAHHVVRVVAKDDDATIGKMAPPRNDAAGRRREAAFSPTIR